jgi:ribonuclease HI
VSDRSLKDATRPQLARLGCPVGLAGDLLGVDFTAGGYLYGRGKARVANKRKNKHFSRKTKIRWLRLLGGNAREVVRGGLAAGAKYGDKVYGAPPGTLCRLRRAFASAAPIRAAGASLSARLALGGPDFTDADPLTTHPNDAMVEVASTVWDKPRLRVGIVRAWRAARDCVSGREPRDAWRAVRGPVGVAMVQLERIGVAWDSPFSLTILGHEVNITRVPPLQVAELLREQARITVDQRMLARLATEHGWDMRAVLSEYRNGIDWDAVRQVLKGQGGLSPAERRVYGIVAVGGIWTEERRWKAGYAGTASCNSCFLAIGTPRHRFHDCDALKQQMLWERLAGRTVIRCVADHYPSRAPLVEMGLPPRAASLYPVHGECIQGSLARRGGEVFIDGSGFEQDSRCGRTAAWSAIRGPCPRASGAAHEVVRGRVEGWFRTVARAELRGAVAALEAAAPGTRSVHDCAFVVAGLEHGVPTEWCSSRNFNADLWSRARAALARIGGGIEVVKTKAHRSRQQAEDDEYDHVGGGWATRLLTRKQRTLLVLRPPSTTPLPANAAIGRASSSTSSTSP